MKKNKKKKRETFCRETFMRWEEGKHLPELKLLALYRLCLDNHPNLNYVITGQGEMFLPLKGSPIPRAWETIPERLKEFRVKKQYTVKEFAKLFGCTPAVWRNYERSFVSKSYKKRREKEGETVIENSRPVPLYILYRLHTQFGEDLNYLIAGA